MAYPYDPRQQKQWNQNGLIDTAIYRPEIQNQQTDEYSGCCGSNSNCCNYG